jgi:hypothetical protein
MFIVFDTFCSRRSIFSGLSGVVLESATYKIYIGVWRSRPTYLLIVITRATFIGNCLQVYLKGISNMVGCNVILGTKIVSPACNTH